MPTIAEIASEAFTAVAAELPDALRSFTLIKTENNFYDRVEARYVHKHLVAGSGTLVYDTTKPVAHVFPEYMPGPSELLVLMQGLSVAPQTGWSIRIGTTGLTVNSVIAPLDTDKDIMRVSDLLGAGSLFYAVVK